MPKVLVLAGRRRSHSNTTLPVVAVHVLIGDFIQGPQHRLLSLVQCLLPVLPKIRVEVCESVIIQFIKSEILLLILQLQS